MAYPHYAPYTAYSYPAAAYQSQTVQPVNGLVSVTGMEGAKAYALPPNSSMPLFDADEDILYVKTTDAGGYPTIKAFRFEPIEQPKHAPNMQYVTFEQFEELKKSFEKLMAKEKDDE